MKPLSMISVKAFSLAVFPMASVYHILFLFALSLPSHTVAQTYRNLSLGDSFTAGHDTAPWVSSPSGEFAFGFYRFPDKELFLLAIWFAKIPEKTVVWSANRTNPVGRRSRVELRNDGYLVLFDHGGNQVWRTTGRATSGAMLDNGDFALTGADSLFVWESFQDPTDTILPTQKLEVNSLLQSRLSDTDYSIGRFQLRLSSGGDLVLNTISPNSKYTYDPYYSSSTDGSGFQVVFDQSGYLYMNLREEQQGGRVNLTESRNMVSPKDFYHRAILEFDGVFRLYIYPKDNPGSRAWKPEWSVVQSLPLDICNVAAMRIGSGICGFNSYCELDENQRPVCKCPLGYSYSNQEHQFNGCKQDFDPPSCELDGLPAEKQFVLEEMANLDWPGSDYELLNPLNEDECRLQCMNDCNCAVAIIRDANCWKKKIPLSNGRRNPQIRGKALIKVAKGNRSSYPSHLSQEVRQGKRDRSSMILIGSLLLGSSVFLNFIFLSAISVAAFFSYNRRKQSHQQESSTLGMNLRSFTYEELEQVTEGFKITLGRGAFGIVYKGVLASNSRNFIAVKKLNKVEEEGEEEFRTEVMAIGQTHHRNLVHLIGFCDEEPHRLLVYELMSNGSLASFIFGSPKPNWNQRKQIVLGIARGLMYLHEECRTQIIHCDIKPQNILLDDCYTARISDFGLAKLLKADQTRTVTDIRGTKGYVAPEWFRKMAITAKVDVYSFGVVLLEIICCRRNIESVPENREDAILMDWAWNCYKERRLDQLMEDGQDTISDIKRLERFVMVAFWCIQDDPSQRPTMKTVTQMLEGAIEVSVPPDPFSSSSFG